MEAGLTILIEDLLLMDVTVMMRLPLLGMTISDKVS